MIFGNRLKEIRKQKGISQKECAEALGVEGSKYNKWENGVNCPDFNTLYKLAIFFDTTSDYLLGLSEERSTEKINFDDMGDFFKQLVVVSKFKLFEQNTSDKSEFHLYEGMKGHDDEICSIISLMNKKSLSENLIEVLINAEVEKYSGISIDEYMKCTFRRPQIIKCGYKPELDENLKEVEDFYKTEEGQKCLELYNKNKS